MCENISGPKIWLQIEQLIAENTIKVKRKFKKHVERILNVCNDYDDSSRVDILIEIAHNFQLQHKTQIKTVFLNFKLIYNRHCINCCTILIFIFCNDDKCIL